MITGLTLEEIARSIGDTYTVAHCPGICASPASRRSTASVNYCDKWQYVSTCSRHSTRALGDAPRASGVHRRLARRRYHAPPPAEVRKRTSPCLGSKDGMFVTVG